MPTISDLARAPQRVFPTLARVERYYPAAAAEEARSVLGRCLDRGEGPALLIGAPGTGKSMLLEVLADDLGKNRPVVCLTSAQLCTRRALLQSILFELGQSYRQRDEGDLRLTLMDYLSGDAVRESGVLLLVDEAQALPIRLLEELRVLGNIAHRGVPTVRLLLAGSQSLEETFTDPEIEAFNQRIVARCYMAPLSHYDTAQFVRGHLAAAGANPEEAFTADALDAVYRATDGIARLVNQVCDRALVLAAGHGQLQVTKEIVEGAWADLQQLPTPWNLPDVPEAAERHDDDGEQVVEFGPLSDDLADDSEECVTTVSASRRIEAPAARVYEPSDEADEADEVETNPERQIAPVAETNPAIEVIRQPVEATFVDEPTEVPSMDDLFGGDFEEEVVIDGYASIQQAIPPSRARVTSACDADLGQLLDRFTPVAEEVDTPAVATAVATALEPELDHREFDRPFTGFNVVDQEEHDEFPDEPTEVDDETDELFEEVSAIVSEASHATAAPTLAADEHDGWSTDDIDILVIEDEMAAPVHSAAACRADYRQLFRTLRNN